MQIITIRLFRSGYTWFFVMNAYAQVGKLKDVSVFFGNLGCHPGRECEGFWADFEDDNDLWTGPRNGVTFGRYNSDNPKLMGPKFVENKYYVVAGRLARVLFYERSLSDEEMAQTMAFLKTIYFHTASTK